MAFTTFLKEQLNGFVEQYKKYFRQTFGIAISFTIICFVVAALLFRFSNFNESMNLKQTSLLSYFFSRYSEGDTYSVVDLTKTVFIFFVALFSVTMIHLNKNGNENKEITFKHSFRALRFGNTVLLIFVLLLACVIDYLLFQAEVYFTIGVRNFNVYKYLRSTFFHLRVYLPLFLFAVTVWFTTIKGSKLTLKRILFLYISLWLFNEVAFEFIEWTRIHLFELILMPVKEPQHYYLFESILGVPLIASSFLGYYVAMIMPLFITEAGKHES
jgi:hypothetical protein